MVGMNKREKIMANAYTQIYVQAVFAVQGRKISSRKNTERTCTNTSAASSATINRT
jgi:hypothetical protein